MDGDPIRVVCVSWNVNAKFSHNLDLHRLLCTSKSAPDIVAIGLQEIVDLSKASQYMLSKESKEVTEAWSRKCCKCLVSGYKGTVYSAVKVDCLVGIANIIIVKQELKIEGIEVGRIPVGTFGIMGNKGAVSISLSMQVGTKLKSLCFVCAHFTARQNEISKRNHDFDTIMKKTSFAGNCNIEDHDIVFWYGDLNYRVDVVSREDMVHHIKQKNLNRLLEYDQLIAEKSSGRVFSNFFEGEIRFEPTYKFKPGTSTRVSDRVPGWCDRILWRSQPTAIQLKDYFSIPFFTISDHKPVVAEFVIPLWEAKNSKQDDIREVFCAMSNFTAQHPDEMSLQHGDVVQILSKQDGWVLGLKSDGFVGYIPCETLSKIGSANKSDKKTIALGQCRMDNLLLMSLRKYNAHTLKTILQPPPELNLAIAHTHHKGAVDELSFEFGDPISIASFDSRCQWFMGEIHGVQGLVDVSNVETFAVRSPEGNNPVKGGFIKLKNSIECIDSVSNALFWYHPITNTSTCVL